MRTNVSKTMVVVVINVVTQEVLIPAYVQLDINSTRQDEAVTEVSWCVSREYLFNFTICILPTPTSRRQAARETAVLLPPRKLRNLRIFEKILVKIRANLQVRLWKE